MCIFRNGNLRPGTNHNNAQTSSLVIVESNVVFNESGIFSPAPAPHLPDTRTVTPPQTACAAISVDATTFAAANADRSMSQGPLPSKRSRMGAANTRSSNTRPRHSPIGTTPAILPLEYDFPKQLAWIPERPQDDIWRESSPTLTNRTPWAAYAFMPSWYGTG